LRFRIHHRLFAGFFGIVGLMGLLTVVLVGSGLRRELIRAFEDELSRQLALAEWIVLESGGAAPDSITRAVTARIGYRTSVISLDGTVLGDSHVARERLPDVESHSDRPEVVGALAGRLAFAQRTSATIVDPLLYGARLVELDGTSVVLRIAAPLTDVDQVVRRAQRAVAVSGLLAMLLALVIAYLASRALSQPLVQLAESARRLAAGDLEERTPGRIGVPELDDLGVAVNTLTEELQARLSELGRERDEAQAVIDCMAEGVVALTEDARVLRTNHAARALLDLPEAIPGTSIGALVEHSELHAILEESVSGPVSAREVRLGDRRLLVSSRTLDGGGSVTTFLDVSEIRRLEQVRNDFVANASHELKTPLTSIRGFAETLLDGDPPERLRQDFLTSIRDNTLRLQRLVDDLLDLSRLESGGWVARLESVSVDEAAREAWAPYADKALGRKVTFRVEGGARVKADQHGLDQVFRNLFENALRHTDEGGRILVVVQRRGEGVVQVGVSDDGEGITAKALPRVFERFYRADSSRARDMGGTGLGLSIVRHLVNGMGGEVTAHSELDRGTTVQFTLPGE
jgi:two-component system phosphate regulon sensor histidine kinase PhoR